MIIIQVVQRFIYTKHSFTLFQQKKNTNGLLTILQGTIDDIRAQNNRLVF